METRVVLFGVRTIVLDVGSEIYPGSHLKDASWGAPQTGPSDCPHGEWAQGIWVWLECLLTPALQRRACRFTSRNLCFLSGKVAVGTSLSSPGGLYRKN